jgi:hypothetical protein
MGELEAAQKINGSAKFTSGGHVHFQPREPLAQNAKKDAQVQPTASVPPEILSHKGLEQVQRQASNAKILATPVGDKLTLARYSEEASRVRSVVPFVKAAFPEHCADVSNGFARPLEKLYDKDRVVCRCVP